MYDDEYMFEDVRVPESRPTMNYNQFDERKENVAETPNTTMISNFYPNSTPKISTKPAVDSSPAETHNDMFHAKKVDRR